ncbi:MAG: carbohydrate ABC transporter substrate-binding protein, partial [Acutalibacteraceae bacterium]|nr:carbohydrate ABC transporter substrate-binding protein [Acutalibacteraceae bacterium]
AKEIFRWMEKDVNNLEWAFNSFPSQQFKDDFGNAMLEYSQGKKDWKHVETTFKNSWKSERK